MVNRKWKETEAAVEMAKSLDKNCRMANFNIDVQINLTRHLRQEYFWCKESDFSRFMVQKHARAQSLKTRLPLTESFAF